MNRPTVNSERPFGLSGMDSGVPTHLLWDFSSVQFWGEDAAGNWTIEVTDTRAEQVGSIKSLSLRIYGEQNDGDNTYVFTDEGFDSAIGKELTDEFGTDTVNAAAVRTDTYIDLAEGIIASNSVTHSIAGWTVIENAFTGTGNDRIDGNDANNILRSDAGDDVLEGKQGDDVLDGGLGKDTAVYAGAQNTYSVSWDPTSQTVTVIDNAHSVDGDEGTDRLTNIERLVFKDAEISLAETIGGNAPPVANTTVFDTQVLLEQGMGIDYQLPADAFTDADGNTALDLDVDVSSESGGELPDWLGYDPATGKITGVPPENYQGILKLKIDAIDNFGEKASGILELMFGDNLAPIVDSASELVILEDAGLVNFAINAPTDPEGSDVTVTITELPSIGSVVNKSGNVVAVGNSMSADALTELHYQTADDVNGDAGYMRYEAIDADGVMASTAIHIFVDPVDDAPRFITDSSKLSISYPLSALVRLDMLAPTDPEEVLTTVRINELPELGVVSLGGVLLKVGQLLSLEQLHLLDFYLDQNVNGPIGAVGIQAIDSAGNTTNWRLELEVSGDSAYTQGTSGNDELYGSISNDVLYGHSGDDLLVGNAGHDRLLAGLGNDQVIGGSGNDIMDGSAGKDFLDGGAGADIMAGGPGDDTYIVDETDDLILEVISGGAGGEDLIVTSLTITAPDNVENITAAGGHTISLTGNTLDNKLLGNDMPNTLTGKLGRDTLFGEAGDDILDGGGGVDFMFGGKDNDTYFVNSRADVVGEHADEGVDTISASSSYTLASNIENMIMTGDSDGTLGGNSLDNHLIGNSGNNILAGGLGSDVLEGGLGDDVYILSDQLDTIIDTGGNDTIRSTLDVYLIADIENVELVGISNAIVEGNSLDNHITGNMADNILDGKAGSDVLTGGDGADQYIISANHGDESADVITDFINAEDLLIIDLASFGVDVEAIGLLSSGLVKETSFVRGAGAEALDPNDHFIFDTARGKLLFDEDGSGAGSAVDLVDFQYTSNDLPLLPSDIYVVI